MASFDDRIERFAPILSRVVHHQIHKDRKQEGEDRGEDMQKLCDTFALERVAGMVPAPRQIVITLADRPVPFGQTDPEAVQLFEAYRLENAACIWEMF